MYETPLSLEGSFQGVVNTRTAVRRQEARQQELLRENERRKVLWQMRERGKAMDRKQRKATMLKLSAIGLGSIAATICGMAGLMHFWLSLPLAVGLLALACIGLGRYASKEAREWATFQF